MTVGLFITLFTILSLVASVITEAIKKSFNVQEPTLLAAFVSIVVGWGGGAAAYLLMNIAFTLTSIVSLVLLAPVIWLGATLGYDKVKEIILQVAAATHIK